MGFDPDKRRKDKNNEISEQSINLNRGNAASQIAETDNYTSIYCNTTGVNIMFNVVKAFGSIFSTQGYSTANNLLITLTPGDTVYVIGVDSITLLVSLVPAD
ncbi:MAG: hypothetical protein EAZ86_30095 [Oscillatoriales cyanobacterium]|nr:MAG: hypothetical protein EAZ86_30095 [Oscillatoriales cyanobacterium]